MMCAMLHALDEKVAPGHAALVIVDVQADFCAADGAFGRLGRDLSAVTAMLGPLERLTDAARSAGVMVIFLRFAQTKATESEVYREQRDRGRAGFRYCLEGTPGVEFFHVAPHGDEAVVTKHRYSGFVNTDLDLILRSNGIRTLVMTGVATNGCVDATARDGFMRDYYVVFVEDGTATYWPEQHEATLRTVRDSYGVVAGCEDLIAIWNRGQGAAAPEQERSA
jgi:ureidoacrylate peracid hydrolase